MRSLTISLSWSDTTACSNENYDIMTIDTDKVKRALDYLQAERQAQQDRLQLAAQVKHNLDADNALRTQSLNCNGVFLAN